MKRIVRTKWLSPEEAAKNEKVRKEVERDLPELIAKHEKRLREREEKKNRGEA